MPRRESPDPSTRRGYRLLCGRPRPEESRVRAILMLLDEHYPTVTTALSHDDPFQLLVATILSAQCTDQVVNQVTRRLFARYPDARRLARARVEDVETLVRPTGFFRNKARNIVAAAAMIESDLEGEVPRDLESLTRIPGVARKTANVVLGAAYGLAEGVVVDTHVMRVSRRWGFHDLKDPAKIERCLKEILPRDRWIEFSNQTIWHGRELCNARSPKCNICPFLPHCPEGRKLSKSLGRQ
ncbi:MAG: endonuclease III [Myxococcota bacterium]